MKELDFNFHQGQEMFLLSTASRLAVRLTQSPIQRILDALSQGVKWMGHELDHSSPSSAEVKNVGS